MRQRCGLPCVALGWVLLGCLPGTTGGGGLGGGSGSSGGGAGSSSSYRPLPDAGPPLPGQCGDAGARWEPRCPVGTAGAGLAVIAWERVGATRVWTHVTGAGWAPGALVANGFDRVLAWSTAENVGVVESAGGPRAVRISDGTELAALVAPSWRYRGFGLTEASSAGDRWLCAFSSETDLPDAALSVACVKGVSGSVLHQVLPLGAGQLLPGGALAALNGELLFVVRRVDAQGAHHDELTRLRPAENTRRALLSVEEYLAGSLEGWPGWMFSGVRRAAVDGGPPVPTVVAIDLANGNEVARREGMLASGPWNGDTLASNHGTVLVVDETGVAWAWGTLRDLTAVPVGVAGDNVHAMSARGGFAAVGLAPVSTALVLLESNGTPRRTIDDRDCALGGTQVHLQALGLTPWGDSALLERSELLPDAGLLPRGLSVSGADGCRLDFPDGRAGSNDVQLFTAASPRGRGVYWWAANQGSVDFVDDLPMEDMQVFLVPTSF